MVDNRADEHLKGCRRADTCRRNHVRGHICVETADLEPKLLCALHHSCQKRFRAANFRNFINLCNVDYNFLAVALAGDANHAAVIDLRRADGIQVNAPRDNLPAVVVGMVSDNLRPSG